MLQVNQIGRIQGEIVDDVCRLCFFVFNLGVKWVEIKLLNSPVTMLNG